MITNAAIKYKNGEILDARHHWQIQGLQAKMGIKSEQVETQGFLNHKGEFLDREQARIEAIDEGQLPADYSGQLQSEDLWPQGVLRDAE